MHLHTHAHKYTHAHMHTNTHTQLPESTEMNLYSGKDSTCCPCSSVDDLVKAMIRL